MFCQMGGLRVIYLEGPVFESRQLGRKSWGSLIHSLQASVATVPQIRSWQTGDRMGLLGLDTCDPGYNQVVYFQNINKISIKRIYFFDYLGEWELFQKNCAAYSQLSWDYFSLT
jgi:hypothetical protein